jgi:hypothetical protein
LQFVGLALLPEEEEFTLGGLVRGGDLLLARLQLPVFLEEFFLLKLQQLYVLTALGDDAKQAFAFQLCLVPLHRPLLCMLTLDAHFLLQLTHLPLTTYCLLPQLLRPHPLLLSRPACLISGCSVTAFEGFLELLL